MFIPMAVIFVVTGYFIVSSQLTNIKNSGKNTLDSFDEHIETSLYSIGSQLDIMMSNSSFSLSLKNLLGNMEMEQKDLTFYLVLKNFLNTYNLSSSTIHSIYLYVEDKEHFMTSSQGQIVNISNNTFYDLQWLDEYKNMDREKRIYTSRRWIQKNSYDEPVEVISVYYRNTYLDGVIVINIDKSEYGRLLRNMLASTRQSIFLVNDVGEIVCETDQSFQIDVTVNEHISDYIKNNKIDTVDEKWIKIAGKNYFINYKYSEFMNIYIVSIIPINFLFDELIFYILLAILVLLLDLVIIVVLAYSYTKRSFYYIEECINIFSEAEQGNVIEKKVNRINDEYELLLNNVIYLHLESNRVQLELMEKHHMYEMTEMMALQLQINPHFIFNTLQIMDIEVIQNMGDKSTLHTIIYQLSKVIKYALTTPTVDVTLKEELVYLKAYLEIQSIRFDNNAITYFDIDDSVYSIKVFKMLLQPVLENCFSHGRRGDGQKIVIKIKIIDNGDYIYFSVIDNGRGMSKDNLIKLRHRINDSNSKSIGLTNLNRRLLLRYGVDSGLVIRSKIGMGTIVKFVIPKNSQ